MDNAEKCTAIILAAGRGTRMGAETEKQFLEISGYPLLYYALKCFDDCPLIHEIILVVPEERITYCRTEIVAKYGIKKVTVITAGGKERYESVMRGLALCGDSAYIIIHDGARPLVTEDVIRRVLQSAEQYGSGIAGVLSKDTIRLTGENGLSESTPPRDRAWMVQTPQAFRAELIRRAYDALREAEEGKTAESHSGSRDLVSEKAPRTQITDDGMVVEIMLNTPVRMVQGDYANVKVTTPEDVPLTAALLERDRGAEQ